MVAKSYPKLIHRLRHKVHAQPYLDRLRLANRVQVTGRAFPPAPPVMSRKGQRDVAFLHAISNPQNQFLLRLSDVTTPHLTRIASEYCAAPAGSSLPQIYTRETCLEVLQLLLHFLQQYENALYALKKFKGRKIKDSEVAKFTGSILTVTACGVSLNTILHTSFMDEHFLRLRLHHPPSPASPATIADDPGLPDLVDPDSDLFDSDVDLNIDNPDFDLGYASDTDLDADTDDEFPPGDLLDPSVWRTYAKRFRGLVSNFEAANNLIKHPFSSGDKKLSLGVSVVAFKTPNTSIGEWKVTFESVVSPPNNPPPYNVATAIRKIEALLPTDSKRGLKFQGSQHCEATLAALAEMGDLPVLATHIHHALCTY
jgi:hypothetical protein